MYKGGVQQKADTLTRRARP